MMSFARHMRGRGPEARADIDRPEKAPAKVKIGITAIVNDLETEVGLEAKVGIIATMTAVEARVDLGTTTKPTTAAAVLVAVNEHPMKRKKGEALMHDPAVVKAARGNPPQGALALVVAATIDVRLAPPPPGAGQNGETGRWHLHGRPKQRPHLIGDGQLMNDLVTAATAASQ